MEKKRSFNKGQCQWINVEAADVTVVSALKSKYQLSDEMLTYSIDKNERARVEYDRDTDALLVVYNIPHQQKNDNHYEASPMSFIIKDDQLFTFSTPQTNYIVPLLEGLLHRNPNLTQFALLFNCLFLIADAYFPLVEEVNTERARLNKRLRERTTNKNLLALSDLEVGLVYLVTATRQNVMVLEQIKAQPLYRVLTGDEQEQLDDALIEAKQSVEMTKLASQILDQLSGTYNNLLNNNLNDTMKLLTVWSLILTIPTIVTGFFGMNVKLPFQDNVLGWVIAIVISVGLSAWLLSILWRKIR